jgi:HEAT repeats
VNEKGEGVERLSEYQLFTQALITSDDQMSEAVEELRARGGRSAADRAMHMVGSADRAERFVGIGVLNNFWAEQNFPFLEEFAPVLIRALDTEDEEQLDRVINCLHKTRSPSALVPLLQLARHPSNLVRLRVAQGLPSLVEVGRVSEADPLVSALLAMMRDEDEQVRDWATFGVGSMLNVDGPSIRTELRAALLDSGDDVRAEALAGLVRRRDECAFDEVVGALRCESVGRLAVQAAAILGDERLEEILEELVSWWDVNTADLDWARYRCASGRSQREAEQMCKLEQLVGAQSPGRSLRFDSDIADGEVSVTEDRTDQSSAKFWSFRHLMKACENNLELAAERIGLALAESDRDP